MRELEPNPDLDVDLALLRTFVEVARLGTIGRAARTVGRSQPAISRRLSRLEEQLGVALFEKVGRGLRPTAEGRLLLERCTELFGAVRDLRDGFRDRGGPVRGVVALGTLPSVASHLVIDRIASVLRDHAELRLELLLEHEDTLIDRLRAGAADLLILAGHPDVAGLRTTILHRDRFVAVMAPSAAPRRARKLAASDLASLRYLAWEGPRDTTFLRAQTWARTKGLVTAATPRIPNIETLRKLAARGAGYAILPEYTVKEDVAAKRLVAFELEGLGAALPFVLVERATAFVSRPLDAVRAALLDGA
jgi:DNA-binding transcriptional LysR family regulator